MSLAHRPHQALSQYLGSVYSSRVAFSVPYSQQPVWAFLAGLGHSWSERASEGWLLPHPDPLDSLSSLLLREWLKEGDEGREGGGRREKRRRRGGMKLEC